MKNTEPARLPESKWVMENGQWVKRWFILSFRPFREVAVPAPEAKR